MPPPILPDDPSPHDPPAPTRQAAPRLLVLSSLVAAGTVGLRAMAPALNALGCDAIEIPTVLLSNHPGHGAAARRAIDPAFVDESIDALAAKGWLNGLTALITGYLPTPDLVAAAGRAVARARAQTPQLTYVLDPILGDDPKGLYIDAAAAHALAATLVAHATILTPNRFELAWLTGRTIAGVDDAIAAARTVPATAVIATSIPAPDHSLATVLVTSDDVWVRTDPRHAGVPHGTGDLLVGLIAGHLAQGLPLADAMARAHDLLARVIARSLGQHHLALSALTALVRLP